MSAARTGLIFLGLAAVLGWTNARIAQQEALAAEGDRLLLELGPRDARVLLQGDHLPLYYGLSRELDRAGGGWPAAGRLVVQLDDRGVAGAPRLHEGGDLGPDELLLRYRRTRGGFHVAPDAYFFREGQADRYAPARFAELRVAPEGEVVLIGLLDGAGEALGPSLFER